MLQRTLAATAALYLAALPIQAAEPNHAPPPAPYRKVSELVRIPDFRRALGSSTSIRARSRRDPSWPTITTAAWSAPSS
jgi:hypothetical protein